MAALPWRGWIVTHDNENQDWPGASHTGGTIELAASRVPIGRARRVAGAANPDVKALTAVASLLAAASTWTTSTRS